MATARPGIISPRKPRRIRMKNFQQFFFPSCAWWSIVCFLLSFSPAFAADKLVGIHSSRTMSQSMPWIAQEAGIFKKYDLDFQLVFIASSGMVTAALLGGDAEMTLTGGVGNVRGYVQGVTDRKSTRLNSSHIPLS